MSIAISITQICFTVKSSIGTIKRFYEKYSNNTNVLFVGIFFVFAFLQLRNSNPLPTVFADEWYYSSSSRLLPFSDAQFPSYLFFYIYKLTNYCGEGFLGCARTLNVIFFLATVPFIYSIAKRICSKNIAIFITLISVLSTINTYTAYFMPESMYFFFFWLYTWYVLTHKVNLRHSVFSGIILALMALVKAHAIFIIPGYIAYATFIIIRTGELKRVKNIFIISIIFLSVFLLIRLALGYAFVGSKGLDILGIMYGRIAQETLTIQYLYHLVSVVFLSLKLHLVGLTLLFAVPIATIISLKTKDNIDPHKNLTQYSIQAYTLLTFTSLLLMTIFFTALITIHSDQSEMHRVHMRYYNFTFPLMLIVMASVLSAGEVRMCRIRSFISVLSLLVLACYGFWLTESAFVLSFIDAPELRFIVDNRYLYYLIGILSAISIILWKHNVKKGVLSFLFMLMPLYVFAGNYLFSKELSQRPYYDNYDRAGLFAYNYLNRENALDLVIVGSDKSGLSKALFYMDNPKTSTIEIPKDSVSINIAELPVDKKWLLLIGNHAINNGKLFRIDGEGYSLVKLSERVSIDFTNKYWLGILRTTSGLSTPEGSSTGTWSISKKISLEFVSNLPTKFNVHLKAHTLGPNTKLPFTMYVGREKKEFYLPLNTNDVSLLFETDGKQKTLIIEVPKPMSPKDLGINNDVRKLGIGLNVIDIISMY